MNCPQYGQYEIVYSWLDEFGTCVLSSLGGSLVSFMFCLLGILLTLVYDIIQLSLKTSMLVHVLGDWGEMLPNFFEVWMDTS